MLGSFLPLYKVKKWFWVGLTLFLPVDLRSSWYLCFLHDKEDILFDDQCNLTFFWAVIALFHMYTIAKLYVIFSIAAMFLYFEKMVSSLSTMKLRLPCLNGPGLISQDYRTLPSLFKEIQAPHRTASAK